MNRVQAIKESNRIKRGKMKNIVLLSVLSKVMSNATPHKKDFDCPERGVEVQVNARKYRQWQTRECRTLC